MREKIICVSASVNQSIRKHLQMEGRIVRFVYMASSVIKCLIESISLLEIVSPTASVNPADIK